jgi:hypothetical protein
MVLLAPAASARLWIDLEAIADHADAVNLLGHFLDGVSQPLRLDLAVQEDGCADRLDMNMIEAGRGLIIGKGFFYGMGKLL